MLYYIIIAQIMLCVATLPLTFSLELEVAVVLRVRRCGVRVVCVPRLARRARLHHGGRRGVLAVHHVAHARRVRTGVARGT